MKALRQRAGLKQSEAAEAIGVKTTTISQWEGGHSAPSPKRVKSMAELYGIEAETIFAAVAGQDTPTSKGRGTISPGALEAAEEILQEAAQDLTAADDAFRILEQTPKAVVIELARKAAYPFKVTTADLGNARAWILVNAVYGSHWKEAHAKGLISVSNWLESVAEDVLGRPDMGEKSLINLWTAGLSADSRTKVTVSHEGFRLMTSCPDALLVFACNTRLPTLMAKSLLPEDAGHLPNIHRAKQLLAPFMAAMARHELKPDPNILTTIQIKIQGMEHE